MNLRAPIALFLSMLGGSALADDSTPAVEHLRGPVPEEVRAFDDAIERFRSRVGELELSTSTLLNSQKSLALSQITKRFDAQLAQVNVRETSDRAVAIRAFEDFLSHYDAVAPASEVRLRLAELYFRVAEDSWLISTTAYFKEVDAANGDLDRLEAIESQGEPKIDLTRVIVLLDRIVNDNATVSPSERYALLDVTYYMLAFCYAEPNSAQRDRDRARQVFRDLVIARPDSDYADAAHLLLGNYFFEDNQYASSIPEFEAVLAQGPERRNYLAALYQLAWARYKLNDYDESMARFVDLLDRSEKLHHDTGRPSEFAPDAVSYLALSLADQSDAHNVTPLEEAKVFFARVGNDKPYRWDVLKSLAEALVRYSRQSDAVAVYESLQTDPAFKFRPENPDFQDTVVKLLTSGASADLVAGGAARLEMTENYGEGSAWWNANRANPEALSQARKYTEAYLLEVAIELKARAQDLADAGKDAKVAYGIAADRYQEYLKRFPISDGYFENQFQLADALYQAGRYDEAATEYKLLVRDEKFHKYGDAAAFMLFRARNELLAEKVGPIDQRSAKSETDRRYATQAGNEIVVYQLLDEQKALVESADDLLLRDIPEPTEAVVAEMEARGEPNLYQIVEDNRSKILYLPAQMLFYANRFDEARPRLQKIIKEFPESDEAAYSANLFLNTYITEGDNTEVRRWSREFAAMRLGSLQTAAARGAQFQSTYERASYQVGLDAAKRADYAAAVDAYMGFIAEFPKSPNVPDALLSAAANNERIGHALDAAALYERFLREYPDHPEAKPFYFTLASNYESVFDLPRAIGYYEEFVKRFPTDKNAANAQYDLAFLKEGIGDHLGAAVGYDTYATRYTTAADREDVAYRAGRQYEEVDSDRAITFYRGYLKSFGTKNPDHAIEAQSRIAELERAAGRTREAAADQAAIVTLFDRVVAAGGKVGPAGRDVAAEAAFPALQAQYQKIVDHKLIRNEKKDTDLLLTQIPAEIAAFDAAAQAYVDRYLSFDHTIAAIYLQGMTRRMYAKLGFSVVPPAGLSEEQTEAYWELLEENLFPQFEKVEQAAALYLQKGIDLGKSQKRHSPWIDKCIDALHDIDPIAHPGQKDPLLGTVDAHAPADLATVPWPEPPKEDAPKPVTPAGGAP